MTRSRANSAPYNAKSAHTPINPHSSARTAKMNRYVSLEENQAGSASLAEILSPEHADPIVISIGSCDTQFPTGPRLGAETTGYAVSGRTSCDARAVGAALQLQHLTPRASSSEYLRQRPVSSPPVDDRGRPQVWFCQNQPNRDGH